VRGQLKLVVDRAFVELWQPLTDHDDCPPNVFAEVYDSALTCESPILSTYRRMTAQFDRRPSVSTIRSDSR